MASPAFRSSRVPSVATLSISPDSKWAATGSWDGIVALWDITSGAMVGRWAAHPHGTIFLLAFSSDSQYLASVPHTDDTRARIWPLDGGRPQVLEGLTGGVTKCVWSPRGEAIALGSRRAAVQIWDTNTFQPLHVFEHIAHKDPIELIEFSPDGHWLLTGCLPSSYCIWDVALGTGRELDMGSRIPMPAMIPIAAAFYPGSTRFVIVTPDGLVEVQSTGSGEWRAVLVGDMGGNTVWDSVWEFIFSPDGRLMLSVLGDRVGASTMGIWDTYTGIKLLSLEGHEGEVVSKARFSPCGNYIASVSKDGTVRLWRTNDGSCIATLSEHDPRVRHISFSPNGKSFVLGTYDGLVIMRRMRDILPMDERDQ